MEAYLVCAFLRPTKKAAEDGEVPSIVVPATVVLAKDEGQAAIKGGRLVPQEHENKDDRLEVRVIPFRRTA